MQLEGELPRNFPGLYLGVSALARQLAFAPISSEQEPISSEQEPISSERELPWGMRKIGVRFGGGSDGDGGGDDA